MAVRTKKPSRNSVCPCGSGRKLKHCCLRKIIHRRRLDVDTARPRLPASSRFTRQAEPATSVAEDGMATWKWVVCQIPLNGGRFLTVTLACTSAHVQQQRLQLGRFLTLDLPEIEFRGQALVIAVRDACISGAHEGELVLAMERRQEGDFGVLVYGKGPLAHEALERRRQRSREVVLVMEKPDGGRTDITLLRFVEWLDAHGAEVGREIFLDLPEMGARGFARVVAVNPCPPIPTDSLEDASLRFVTGTFKHTSGEVYDLKLQSESTLIGVTATHPFWSVDRNAWVSAIDLEIGETLKTLTGTTVVESRSKREEPETVYNIEVDGDHCYRVGESGVLVHNTSADQTDEEESGEEESSEQQPQSTDKCCLMRKHRHPGVDADGVAAYHNWTVCVYKCSHTNHEVWVSWPKDWPCPAEESNGLIDRKFGGVFSNEKLPACIPDKHSYRVANEC